MLLESHYRTRVAELVDCGVGRGLALVLAEQGLLIDHASDQMACVEIKHIAQLARIRWSGKQSLRKTTLHSALFFASCCAISLLAHVASLGH